MSHPAASDVPLNRAITGLSGATLLVDDLEATARVLMDVLGWVESGRAELPGFERVRFTQATSTSQGARIELLRGQSIPPARRGAGSIHHIAFRARNDDEQAEMVALRRRVMRHLAAAGTKKEAEALLASMSMRYMNGEVVLYDYKRLCPFINPYMCI